MQIDSMSEILVLDLLVVQVKLSVVQSQIIMFPAEDLVYISSKTPMYTTTTKQAILRNTRKKKNA